MAVNAFNNTIPGSDSLVAAGDQRSEILSASSNNSFHI
jgi:hypothetical protein